MNEALKAVLSAPPLKRITPGAAQAIASVEALAEQQANAPQEAAEFTEPKPDNKGLSCSFSWNPESLILDFSAPQNVLVDAAKLNGQFSITIRF